MAKSTAFSEGFKGGVSRQAAPIAKAAGALGRVLNNVRVGVNDAYVTRGYMELPFATAGGLALGKFCFGCTISGAVVTVKAGEVQWGRSTFTVGDTGVTLTADYQYVGVECNGTIATVIGPDANVTLFRSDDSTFRTWLCQFRLVSGRAALYRIGHIGNILIPAVYAV